MEANPLIAFRHCGFARNKPRQSKQLTHVAIASVVLNSAIASAATPAHPAAAVHTACSPLGSAAALAHRYRVQTPQGHTKTSRGKSLGRAQFGSLQRRRTCESSGSCAHSMQPVEQRCFNRASLLRARTAGANESTLQLSKQLVHAAKAPLVLDPALGTATTPANPVVQLCTRNSSRWLLSNHAHAKTAGRHCSCARLKVVAEQALHECGESHSCSSGSLHPPRAQFI